MRRFLLAALLFLALSACGIKAPPKPPVEQPAPAPGPSETAEP